MSNSQQQPAGVLLVGSIPLSTAEEVFTIVPPTLQKGKLHALPDGEPGERDTYILWQRERFPAEARHKNFLSQGTDLPANHPGFTKDSIAPTGYGDAACSSYKKFARLQQGGVIPADLRFQVSLPSPQDCIHFYLRTEYHAKLGPFYEERMRDSVNQILREIPNDKLAIQWDIAVLPTFLEYEKGRAGRLPRELFSSPLNPAKEGFIQHLVPFCDMIPTEATLGLHICYGDFQHRHHIEPEDMGVLVNIANSMVEAVGRPVEWIHMPVPKSRDDLEYFAPLKDLKIGKARLYLGLVHVNDEEGTKRRIATAQSVMSNFGVATECGLGRFSVSEMYNLLGISNNVTVPMLE